MIACSAPPVWPTWSAPYHSATASKYGADEAVDVVARRRPAARRASSATQPGPAVQRAPDAERRRERVPALDRPVARAEQPERGPRPGGQHQVARQRRAVPAEQPDRLAPRSSPGRRPAEQPADAVGRLARGVLERGELVHVVDDPQAVGRVDEQVVRVLDRRRGPTSAPQLVDEERRAPRCVTGPRTSSSRARRPACPARSPPPPGSRASGRDRSRGWLGRLRSWNRSRRIGERRGAGHARSTRCRRGSAASPSGADDEDRLLEPRVEAGQERQVRAVLAVRVHDQPVVARARPRARAARPAAPGSAPAGSSGARPGMPKSGRSIVGEPGRASSSVIASSAAGGVHGIGRGRAALDVDELVRGDRHPRARPRRRATSPGPRPRSRGPSPTCVQPSWPPTWPPPTVELARGSSRVAGLRLDHRADRVAVRAGLAQPQRRASGPSAPAHPPCPHPTFRQSADGAPRFDLDEVEQPVEVEVGERRAAAAVEGHDARPPRRPRRTCRRPGRGTGCSGPSSRSRAARRRCPWRRTGR